MCAINGCSGEDRALMERMTEVTLHRGPDGTRIYTDAHISLGFNRLAIIDLSERAMHPLVSPDGRYRIIMNGEIFNYRELKKELAGYPFVSDGDTEVVLAAYIRWGKVALARLNGQFALAIYDRDTGAILLARDPVGIKPLYYSLEDNKLIFSSELPAMLEALPRKLSDDVVTHYLRLLYVPQDRTLVRGIKKLMPGHLLTYKDGVVSVEKYSTVFQKDTPSSYQGAMEKVKTDLDAAVQRQLVSDRPVGIYLSGGIDSSVILAAASAVHPAINTYSIGFDLGEGEEKEKFNADAEIAKRTAHHFGATHHSYELSSNEVLALIPEALKRFHQPVANATSLAQLFLAHKTKETATVVLSGEGGDELFGGYERYRLALLASYTGPFALQGINRFAQLMFQKDAELILKDRTADTKGLFASEFTTGTVASLLRADEHNWLVDEALLRADAMGMAASVEVRVPFLDLEIRALAHALPREWKVTLFGTKRILKDAYRNILPQELFTQPKRGWFSPGAKWLRRPEFVSYAEELFSNDRSGLSELIDILKVRELWLAHCEKRSYHYATLWSVITLLAWAREHRLTRI